MKQLNNDKNNPVFVYESSAERNNHILSLCAMDWICTNIAGEEPNLTATFKKKLEVE